jgi:superfamily II DNA or RNA helicase
LILVIDNSFTKIVDVAPAEYSVIRDALSYEVAGADHIKRKNPRLRSWDGTKSFLDGRRKHFLTGFLPRVEEALKTYGVAYEIADNREAFFPSIKVNENVLDGITLRDYQVRSIEQLLSSHRGVAQLATGAGKTEIAIAITAMMGVPTLFLTHRVNLLHQTAERFAKRIPQMRSKIGIIGDGNWSENEITIATVQTLHNALKKDTKAVMGILSRYKLLFIDEAHRSGAKQFYETAAACNNALYRFGLTATPFMKGNAEDDMWLEGTTGKVITKVTNGELIKRGILARPYFKFIPVNTRLPRKITKWRDVYEHGIIKNVERNIQVVKWTKALAKKGKKPLVIVLEYDHGQILEDTMNSIGMKAQFVDGRTDSAQRTKYLKDLASGRLDAIICTNIFDEGIDVCEIGSIVLAAGTKAAPALFQRTGRAIRAKDGDNTAIIVDFLDNHHWKLREHSERRYAMVKNEDGFVLL